MSGCLMCGCGEFTALFHGSDRLYHTTTKQFSVVSCDVCGLLRLDPRSRRTISAYAPYAAVALRLIRDGENVGTYGWD